MVKITAQFLQTIVRKANRTVQRYSFNHKDPTVAVCKCNPSCSHNCC